MLPSTSPINRLAPAKINVGLRILGRRPDGYHEIISVMVPVGLYDRLEFMTTGASDLRLECRGLAVPEGPENLVWHSARAFFSRTGIESKITIRLTKNIPVAAGLGGGSSDAATTLLALNEMWARPLSEGEMEELALALGADIPFFLKGGPCLAKGIGEILDPIRNWPKFWYVIVSPPIAVPTSWVYGNLKLKLTLEDRNSIILFFNRVIADPVNWLQNDLEKVTIPHYPVIGEIKKSLMEAGAEGALMSGSGPSVFGIFKSQNQALRAKGHLISKALGSIFVVECVARKDWGVVKW